MPQPSKPFLGADFLLDNDRAITLYHQFASAQPILDYHNHLPPKDIAENKKFTNLTELWLQGDHYKWRAMRANGIGEEYCTGTASPEDKFKAWAATVPYTIRNPLYHWTHLELKRYFGIDRLLDENSATDIYHTCNEMLQQEDFRAQGLLSKMNVEVVCTTDDPIDSLDYHRQMHDGRTPLKMYPSFRSDKSYSFAIPANYNTYIDSLSSASGVEIITLDDLMRALMNRIVFFNGHGCRSADHGLEEIGYDEASIDGADQLFVKIRSGNALAPDEQKKLRAAILFQLCKYYHTVGWVQQFHLGALRATNARMLRQTGPDTGFDSIGDFHVAQGLSEFLNALADCNKLGKTILYNLNPSLNEVVASMAGNFNEGTFPGKMQFGSAWWFLDQKNGMERQLTALSSIGLLSRFVGMITDSRSFLSFPRHEYFRRILCNLIGTDMINGEIPDDMTQMGKMISDICYFNTKRYFNF